MAPGRHVHPHPGECDLIWKRGLRRCNRTTDLEVRSSWIIPVGAESHDKCPYERERGGGCGGTQRRPWKAGQTGVMRLQAKGCRRPPEAGRERKDPPLDGRRSPPCSHPDGRLPTSRAVRESIPVVSRHLVCGNVHAGLGNPYSDQRENRTHRVVLD